MGILGIVNDKFAKVSREKKETAGFHFLFI